MHTTRNSHWIRVVVTLALAASGGCCRLDCALQRLSHWQEIRCDCLADSCCPTEIPVASPAGYLAEGPTLLGEGIASPPGETAVDAVVDLLAELESLQKQNEQLKQELQQAQQTISEQEQALTSAQRELQQSIGDFAEVRGRLQEWQSELAELDVRYQAEQRDQDETLMELEQKLAEILSQCQSGATPAEESQHVSLMPPKNTTAIPR